MRAPLEQVEAPRAVADVAEAGPSRFLSRATCGLVGAYLAIVAGAFAVSGAEAWPLLVMPVPLLVLLLHYSASMKLLCWAHGSPIREVFVALVIIVGSMVLLSGLGFMMDGQVGSPS